MAFLNERKKKTYVRFPGSMVYDYRTVTTFANDFSFLFVNKVYIEKNILPSNSNILKQ